MSLAQYLIQINSGDLQTLSALGINSAQLTFRANGIDTLDLSVSSASFYGASVFSYGDLVSVYQRDSAYPGTPDKRIFRGSVEGIPRLAAGGGEQVLRYQIKGPSYDLQLCHFAQQWTYRTAAGVVTKSYEPTVCLGEDNSGTRLTSGEQITQALNYAITCGVDVSLGTVATGVTVPFDERSNITCWDAIVSMLRYTPDYVLWWDYSAASPALNVTAPASMPVKSLAQTTLSAAAFVPRYDIQVPGISITFNYTDNIDGQTSRTRVVQTAGNSAHPRTLHLVYDLEGVNVTYLQQEVVVEDYPADWTVAAGKAWLEAQIPWLASLSSYTVDALDRSGSLSLPARLISGSIAAWMDKDQEAETFTATVSYTKLDSTSGVVEKAVKKLSFQCLSTDAVSKTYRKQGDYLGPEPVPSNLASNLYASWSRLHWDGEIAYTSQLCPADILPGHALNVTGALTEWASMSAIVQDAALDLFSGRTELVCGTCGRLEADNLIAVFRAARGRSFCYRRESRDASDSTSGDIPGTGSTAKSDTADGAPAEQIHRLRVVDTDGTNSHIIDLYPASVLFGDAADQASQTLAPRERVLYYMDSGVLKAKLHQVICSEGHGDEIDIHPRPADPSTPKELGSTSETDLGSQAAYNPGNPESGKDGVALVVSLGSYYDDTAATPLLKDFRVVLTWPNSNAPTISAVTAVTIDTPEEES